MNSLSKASSNYELPVKRRLVMNSLSKASSNYEQFESSVVKLESSELSQQIYKHLWIFSFIFGFLLLHLDVSSWSVFFSRFSVPCRRIGFSALDPYLSSCLIYKL